MLSRIFLLISYTFNLNIFKIYDVILNIFMTAKRLISEKLSFFINVYLLLYLNRFNNIKLHKNMYFVSDHSYFLYNYSRVN